LKKRLDVILTERGLFATREKARRAVMAGLVFMDGQRFDKPGTQIPEDKEIEVRGDDCPYVSRGGFKLEKALDIFGIDVKDLVCLDIGASTGGFTDCMLQRGASRVYAVDVGYGQLDWSLRNDERVVCMEKTNFRYLEPEDLPEKVDFASGDVSFISLRLMFPPAAKLLKPDSYMICLVKPQFEAGREQVGKHGIIKDPRIHREVLGKVAGYAKESGFGVRDVDWSPIKGTTGNIEFLMLLKLGGEDSPELEAVMDKAVAGAHAALDAKEEVQ
jgi:23S rRNA (cytidine1920-2'-O)/16S rRNA (cytidine1409-2'-O)-methyltransferase